MSNPPAEAKGGPRSPLTNRLNAGDAARQFSEYVVVGTYAQNEHRFVRHVALLAKNVELPADAPVEVWHMGPPIIAGEESAAAALHGAQTKPHLVSDIGLTPDEHKAMKNWRAKVDKEDRPRKPFRQYVVDPPVKWEFSEKGRRMYRRFSCVGFVTDCYASAGIVLLELAAELPLVDENSVAIAYPDLIRIEQADERFRTKIGFRSREDLGLVGTGPWRIALAGYVFHSLQRATAEQPRPPGHVPVSPVEAYYP